MRTTIITFLTLVAFASSAAVAGMLEIGTVQLRATAPGMGMTGGYVAITNNGESDERLIAVSAGFAKRVSPLEPSNPQIPVHNVPKNPPDLHRAMKLDAELHQLAGFSTFLDPLVSSQHAIFSPSQYPLISLLVHHRIQVL